MEADSSQVHKLIKDLHMSYALKVLGEVHYFLGFEVHRQRDDIYLTQAKYIRDLLHKTNMSASTPLTYTYFLVDKI